MKNIDSVPAALEQAASLALQFTAAPRDYLGPATPAMKEQAALGERLAAAIRALHVTAAPVAVPDGWKIVPLKADAAQLMAGRKQTFADMTGAHMGPSAENTYSAMVAAASAAPAAQGDAKDAELIAELRSVYAIYNGHGEDLRDLAERAANRIAAIAAKAAA